MFRKCLFYRRGGCALILVVSITASACPQQEVHSDRLDRPIDRLNAEASDDSEASSGYASDCLNAEASDDSEASSGYGSSAVSPSSPATPPFAALPNTGNTCYMNAVLQIIAALYADKLPESPLKELITKINTTHKPLEQTDIKQFIKSLPESKVKKMAQSLAQEDPDEFILLLNELYPFLDAEGMSEGSNWMLHVNFSANSSRSLSKMIKSSSVCRYICDRLYIQLVRHKMGSKIRDDVHHAMHIDITTHPSPNEKHTATFDLNGFIQHIGPGLYSGHYIAYVKRKGKWYQVNDLSITAVSEQKVERASKQAYLLFYKKVK